MKPRMCACHTAEWNRSRYTSSPVLNDGARKSDRTSTVQYENQYENHMVKLFVCFIRNPECR